MKKPRPVTRAAAIASLHEGWRLAKESGPGKVTDEEIDAEIAVVRAARLNSLRGPES